MQTTTPSELHAQRLTAAETLQNHERYKQQIIELRDQRQRLELEHQQRLSELDDEMASLKAKVDSKEECRQMLMKTSMHTARMEQLRKDLAQRRGVVRRFKFGNAAGFPALGRKMVHRGQLPEIKAEIVAMQAELDELSELALIPDACLEIG